MHRGMSPSIPLQSEGHLLLEVLHGVHPRATGLVFTEEDGRKRRTMAVQGQIPAPSGGWKDKVMYIPFVPSHVDSDTTNKELAELRTQLQELSGRKPSKFVMAPERKIPVFEGKASEIDDFISGINGAFSRIRHLGGRKYVLSP